MLEAPARRDGLDDRNAHQRIRVRAQEGHERVAARCAIEVPEEVEQPEPAFLGPAVRDRGSRATRVERVDAPARVGGDFIRLIERGDGRRQELSEQRDRRTEPPRPVRAAGMTQVVVRELVPEGERDDLVEDLVCPRNPSWIGPNLRRDQARGQQGAAVRRGEAGCDEVRIPLVRPRPVELVGGLRLRDGIDRLEEALGGSHKRGAAVIACGERVHVVRARVEHDRDVRDPRLVVRSKVVHELSGDRSRFSLPGRRAHERTEQRSVGGSRRGGPRHGRRWRGVHRGGGSRIGRITVGERPVASGRRRWRALGRWGSRPGLTRCDRRQKAQGQERASRGVHRARISTAAADSRISHAGIVAPSQPRRR